MLKEKDLSATKRTRNSEKCESIRVSAAVILGTYGESEERTVFAGKGKNEEDKMEMGKRIKPISCYITPAIEKDDFSFRISQNVVGIGERAKIGMGFVVEVKDASALWTVYFRSPDGGLEIINSSGKSASREELDDYAKLLDRMRTVYQKQQLQQETAS